MVLAKFLLIIIIIREWSGVITDKQSQDDWSSLSPSTSIKYKRSCNIRSKLIMIILEILKESLVFI